MLDVYLDESGIHDEAAACVVAGYFGGRGQWRKFENDWNSLLRNFDVPLSEFHAKDLFPRPSGFFLHHWDASRHSEFLQAIADTIARNTKIHPVSFSIIVDDFFSYSHNVRRFFTGATMRNGKPTSSGSPSKPYFVPFQQCIIQVCNYAPVGGNAHFFFGLDRPFYGYATELFKQMQMETIFRGAEWSWKDRLGMPAFPKASETPPLQAADFLCHLTYHHILKAGENLGQVFASPLLFTCMQNYRSMEDFQFLNKASLREVLIQAADLSLAVRGLGLT